MMRHFRLSTLVALFLVIPAVAVAAAPFAYITNSGTGTVSVIDIATNLEVVDGRIGLPVGSVPYGVVLSPDGKTLYVSNFGNGALYVIDLATREIRTLRIASVPLGVAVHPSGSHVYVAHASNVGGMTYFDTATFTPRSLASGRVSVGVATNASKDHLYVTNLFGFTVFSLSSHELLATATIGTRGFGVAVSPDGEKFYVALPSRNQLAVVNASSPSFSYQIVDLTGARSPQGVAVSPDGKLVFVSNHDSGNVSVVDGVTNAFIRNVSVQTKPYGLQVTPDGSRVYVANWQSSSLSIIDTKFFTATHIPLGGTMAVAFGLFMPSGKGAITVGVDIMPGGNPNTINLRSNGTLPVAILGTAEFDVNTIDPASVSVAGAPVVIKKNGLPQSSFDDVNGDGFIDLIVHVDRERLQLKSGDTQAAVEGKTYDGVTIQGVDSVRVLPSQ